MYMIVHSPKELALALAWERKRKKLGQTEVAEEIGSKQKTISAFENKPERTKIETLFRILAVLELEIVIQPRGTKTEWKEQW